MGKILLTDRGDHRDGKVKGAGEPPLPPGAVRLRLDDHSLDLPVVILGEVVLLLQLGQLLLQRLLLWTLTVRLQRVKHGGSNEQVEDDGEDETQRPDVLRLHPQLRSARWAEGGRREEAGGRVLEAGCWSLGAGDCGRVLEAGCCSQARTHKSIIHPSNMLPC